MMSDKLLCINVSKPDADISQFATNSDDNNRRGGMHTPTKNWNRCYLLSLKNHQCF